MLVFGHGTLEPDNLINSAASLVRLRSCGADGVELDVRITSDGQVVVIHDPAYPDGRRVSHTPAMDRPADIVDLEAALDLCAGLVVNIELKSYPGDVDESAGERLVAGVIELLDVRNGRDRVLLSSFGLSTIDAAVLLAPQHQTAHLVLSRRHVSDVLAPCVAHGHGIVHPYVDMVDERFMAHARRHNLVVNAWTSLEETADAIASLISLGVDGVITPYPERAMEIRG